MSRQDSPKTLQQQQELKPITITHQSAQERIQLVIETPTDWPTVIATLAVGIGSVLTSLIVGYLSYQNQRSQVRSSIASLRSAWINELRKLSAEFIGLAVRLGYGLQKSASHLDSSEGSQDLSNLYQAASEIHLMLDPNKPETKHTASKMDSVVEYLRQRDFAMADSGVPWSGVTQEDQPRLRRG